MSKSPHPKRMSSATSSKSMASSAGLNATDFKISEDEINQEIAQIPRRELQEIRKVFEYIDKDGSNAISLEELEALFDCLPQKLSKYEVTRMFNMLDDDNDGTIVSRGGWKACSRSCLVAWSLGSDASLTTEARAPRPPAVVFSCTSPKSCSDPPRHPPLLTPLPRTSSSSPACGTK